MLVISKCRHGHGGAGATEAHDMTLDSDNVLYREQQIISVSTVATPGWEQVRSNQRNLTYNHSRATEMDNFDNRFGSFCNFKVTFHSSFVNSLVIFSRESDSTTTNVHKGCGYIKTGMWLYSKRCGYIAQMWLYSKRCGYMFTKP